MTKFSVHAPNTGTAALIGISPSSTSPSSFAPSQSPLFLGLLPPLPGSDDPPSSDGSSRDRFPFPAPSSADTFPGPSRALLITAFPSETPLHVDELPWRTPCSSPPPPPPPTLCRFPPLPGSSVDGASEPSSTLSRRLFPSGELRSPAFGGVAAPLPFPWPLPLALLGCGLEGGRGPERGPDGGGGLATVTGCFLFFMESGCGVDGGRGALPDEGGLGAESGVPAPLTFILLG